MTDEMAVGDYRTQGHLSIGDALKSVPRALRRDGATLLALTLVFGAVPLFVWSLFEARIAGGLGDDDGYGVIGAVAIAYLVNLASYLLVQAALVQASYRSLRGERAAFGQSIAGAASVVLPLLGFLILYILGIFGGFMLFIVPGIVLIVMWSVAVPALVLERSGVIGAFGRSRRLTKGHRWSIFGLFLLLFVASMVGGGILGAAIVMLTGAPDAISGSGLWVAAAINGLITGLVNMVGAILVTALFIQLRELEEGPDVAELEDIFS
ncbi:hypothetical protein [uncultured Croceicoccus sp.]|uniref:hypothetical protein n=1 Tax=uncultured Croceicoccus sp. TaxID=1295329 RepID=UPI002624F9BA|nr:hypothetical protein [uncultured Croceicoccus sp.]